MEEVTKLLDHAGIYGNNLCRTLQLNTVWPAVYELQAVKQHYPSLDIMLQLGSIVLDASGPAGLSSKLGEYANLVDYVLIDRSGSRGRPFETSFAVPFYEVVLDVLPEKALIV